MIIAFQDLSHLDFIHYHGFVPKLTTQIIFRTRTPRDVFVYRETLPEKNIHTFKTIIFTKTLAENMFKTNLLHFLNTPFIARTSSIKMFYAT